MGKHLITNRQVRKRLSIPIRVSGRCIAISKAQTCIAWFSASLQVGFLSHQFHQTLDHMHRWLPQSLRGDSGIADATACTRRGKGVYCPGLRQGPKPKAVTKYDKVVPCPCCISWKQTRLAEAKVVRCLALVRIWLCVFLSMKEFRMKSQKRQTTFVYLVKTLQGFGMVSAWLCARLQKIEGMAKNKFLGPDSNWLWWNFVFHNVATTSDGPALASFFPTLSCLCQRGGRLPWKKHGGSCRIPRTHILAWPKRSVSHGLSIQTARDRKRDSEILNWHLWSWLSAHMCTPSQGNCVIYMILVLSSGCGWHYFWAD